MTALTVPLLRHLPPLLTVYYDGHCALCCAEMAEIRQMDTHHEVAFIDCAEESFDDSALRPQGVTRESMLQTLHVRDVLGDWHRGVDAIALLYATVGAPWLARAWAHPLTRPVTRRLYPWIVRHRHRLSALGLHFVAPRALRLFARRHGPHAAPYCAHGTCRAAPGGPAHAATATAHGSRAGPPRQRPESLNRRTS